MAASASSSRRSTERIRRGFSRLPTTFCACSRSLSQVTSPTRRSRSRSHPRRRPAAPAARSLHRPSRRDVADALDEVSEATFVAGTAFYAPPSATISARRRPGRPRSRRPAINELAAGHRRERVGAGAKKCAPARPRRERVGEHRACTARGERRWAARGDMVEWCGPGSRRDRQHRRHRQHAGATISMPEERPRHPGRCRRGRTSQRLRGEHVEDGVSSASSTASTAHRSRRTSGAHRRVGTTIRARRLRLAREPTPSPTVRRHRELRLRHRARSVCAERPDCRSPRGWK